MLRNLNCPIIFCLWLLIIIIMVALLITPLFRCLANLSFLPHFLLLKKVDICQNPYFAIFRLVTPPKPPRRTTPTRSVERPKISTVLLPTYSNNVNTNNTNINTNTNNTNIPVNTTDPANSMDLSSFTAVSSLSSSTFLVRMPLKLITINMIIP